MILWGFCCSGPDRLSMSQMLAHVKRTKLLEPQLLLLLILLEISLRDHKYWAACLLPLPQTNRNRSLGSIFTPWSKNARYNWLWPYYLEHVCRLGVILKWLCQKFTTNLYALLRILDDSIVTPHTPMLFCS